MRTSCDTPYKNLELTFGEYQQKWHICAQYAHNALESYLARGTFGKSLALLKQSRHVSTGGSEICQPSPNRAKSFTSKRLHPSVRIISHHDQQ